VLQRSCSASSASSRAAHWRSKRHRLTSSAIHEELSSLAPSILFASFAVLKEEEGDEIVYQSLAWQRREGWMTNHGVISKCDGLLDPVNGRLFQ
jgi:hypothetical protein